MDPDHPAGACPVWVTACPDWLQLDPKFLIWEAKVLWQIKRLRDKVDALIRLYK
jgi:hypothetical protein